MCLLWRVSDYMINTLFSEDLMDKYYSDFELSPDKEVLIRKYISKIVNNDFKDEESNYTFFYDWILKEILEYDLEKNIRHHEKVDEGRGKSEFVLENENKKFMVIELKSQGTNLDEKQSGRDKSPVDQAFLYALKSGDVQWILVSDYNEFKLYNYFKKTRYISFKFTYRDKSFPLGKTEIVKKHLLISLVEHVGFIDWFSPDKMYK